MKFTLHLSLVLQDELNSKMSKMSKEKDGILSKMNLWMKSCKQLESEKQALAEETQKQAEVILGLKASQKQGRVQMAI